jgi:hypothetical protein
MHMQVKQHFFTGLFARVHDFCLGPKTATIVPVMIGSMIVAVWIFFLQVDMCTLAHQ